MNTSQARCNEAMSKVDLFDSGFCLTYEIMVIIKYILVKKTITKSEMRTVAESESIFAFSIQL